MSPRVFSHAEFPRLTGRENATQKAQRLLINGRLRIKFVDIDLIRAQCRGDSGEIYTLGWELSTSKWHCSCPARTDCSHLRALWMVVAIEKGTQG